MSEFGSQFLKMSKTPVTVSGNIFVTFWIGLGFPRRFLEFHLVILVLSSSFFLLI